VELTVPEAARRVHRNPETVRRWIRAGRLPARKIGTQHVVDEEDLSRLLGEESDTLPWPPEWKLHSGGRMPDVAATIRRHRNSH